MSKYFDTKVVRTVSAAHELAIAISKKEKGEKPKNEKDEDASQFAFVAKTKRILVKKPSCLLVKNTIPKLKR